MVDIQKSRLGWFEPVMRMGEERMPKKMLDGEKATKRNTLNQMDIPNQKEYRKEMGKLGRNTRKQEMGEKSRLEISL